MVYIASINLMEISEYRKITEQAQLDYEATLERLNIDVITRAEASVAIRGHLPTLDELELRCDR
jgi:hypothetical protein